MVRGPLALHYVNTLIGFMMLAYGLVSSLSRTLEEFRTREIEILLLQPLNTTLEREEYGCLAQCTTVTPNMHPERPYVAHASTWILPPELFCNRFVELCPVRKCEARELDEVEIDDTLHPIEEPVEIMNHEVKRLKRSRIPNVKVRWSFRRGPEYT
ncbi:hypothetical protein Tco_0044777 [Tanacetum coccineum]